MSKSFFIKNRKGQTYQVIVDDDRYDEVIQYNWSPHQPKKNGSVYVARNGYKNGKSTTIRLHQQIMGVAPIGMVIDHINNSGLDNRKANLRFCTVAQNNAYKTEQGVFRNRIKTRLGLSRTLSGNQ